MAVSARFGSINTTSVPGWTPRAANPRPSSSAERCISAYVSERSSNSRATRSPPVTSHRESISGMSGGCWPASGTRRLHLIGLGLRDLAEVVEVLVVPARCDLPVAYAEQHVVRVEVVETASHLAATLDLDLDGDAVVLRRDVEDLHVGRGDEAIEHTLEDGLDLDLRVRAAEREVPGHPPRRVVGDQLERLGDPMRVLEIQELEDHPLVLLDVHRRPPRLSRRADPSMVSIPVSQGSTVRPSGQSRRSEQECRRPASSPTTTSSAPRRVCSPSTATRAPRSACWSTSWGSRGRRCTRASTASARSSTRSTSARWPGTKRDGRSSCRRTRHPSTGSGVLSSSSSR